MRKRVCLVTTTPFIANAFLRPHLLALSARYEVTLALNIRDRYPLDGEIARVVRVKHVPMERPITPLRDASTLALLTKFFHGERFDLVHSVAPKAGLLAMAAAYAARIRLRLHTFQGEVWAAKRGIARAVLKAADHVVGQLATHALVVSRGEQSFLEREGIVARGASTVLGNGSIAGVNLDRFRSDAKVRTETRRELGIDADALVVMYVGRIGRDKGVIELAHAFAGLDKDPWLVFVGPDEENLQDTLRQGLRTSADRARFVGYTRAPERYLASADIVCLPSHREGFGLVLIEAGACGVPVVASNLYGTADAVVEGVTGLFHEPGNIAQIGAALRRLGSDRALRERMGRAGKERVAVMFQEQTLVAAWCDFYLQCLE